MVLTALLFSLGLSNSLQSPDALAFPGQAPLTKPGKHGGKKPSIHIEPVPGSKNHGLLNMTIMSIWCDDPEGHWTGSPNTKCIGKWRETDDLNKGRVLTKSTCNCCHKGPDEYCEDCADNPAVWVGNSPAQRLDLPPILSFDDGGALMKHANKLGITEAKGNVMWGLTSDDEEKKYTNLTLADNRMEGARFYHEDGENFVSIYSSWEYKQPWKEGQSSISSLAWTPPTMGPIKVKGGTKPYTECLWPRGELTVEVNLVVVKFYEAEFNGTIWEFGTGAEYWPANLTITNVPGPYAAECFYATPPKAVNAICLENEISVPGRPPKTPVE